MEEMSKSFLLSAVTTIGDIEDSSLSGTTMR